MGKDSRIPAPLSGATYSDLLAAPEGLVAQLVDGVLYTHPRPAPPHAEAASVLGMDLGGPFHRGKGGPGGWMLLFKPELHFAGNVLVPDLAAWQRARMPKIPDAAFFTLAPDWVCEVLSPATALLDRRNKLPIYVAEGISHCWLVDPARKTVEVLALDGESYRLVCTAGERDVARLVPFDAIELELGALWPDGATAESASPSGPAR